LAARTGAASAGAAQCETLPCAAGEECGGEKRDENGEEVLHLDLVKPIVN
jgi:hypothetical protein